MLKKHLPFFLLPALLLSTPVSLFAAYYLDTPAGYRRIGGAARIGPYSSKTQCESVNSQYFSGQGTCSGSPDSGSSSSFSPPSSNPFDALFRPFGEALGQQIECAINPNCPANQQRDAILEQQRQQELARQQAEQAEEERRRAQEFEAARQRILGGLRPTGAGSETVAPRDLSGARELQVTETTGPLGSKVVVPASRTGEVTSLRPRDLGSVGQMTPAQRAACSYDYLVIADQRAAARDYDGAAAISNQARQIMNGEATPSAPCTGPPSNIPEVGKPVEIINKQAQVMSALYRRAANQSSDYRAARSRAEEDKAKQQAAEEQMRQAQERVRQLQTTPPPPLGEPPPAQDNRKLEEGLKALQESQAALDEAKRIAATQNKAAEEAQGKLNETESFVINLQRGPADYDQIMQQLNLPQSGG